MVFELFGSLENVLPALITIIVLILIYVVFETIIRLTKKKLLEKATTKKQVTNIELFSRILKYLALLFLFVFAVSSYSGSWAGFGLGIGLLSAAIGFALQKPITGIAAWIMMITKRPFHIGDRIIIGKLKGDVIDITLTHIYLHEIGGIVPGEENSGRIILVPNSILFEQNIVNYSMQHDEIVLDQVVVPITYESNLNKAIEIALNSAKKHIQEFVLKPKNEPYIRTFFQPNGINVHVRYFAPVKRLQEFSSKITKEIYDEIMKTKDVKFAYPHQEVILSGKETLQTKKS
jgi:small-conductance mechanosensitive channel